MEPYAQSLRRRQVTGYTFRLVVCLALACWISETDAQAPRQKPAPSDEAPSHENTSPTDPAERHLSFGVFPFLAASTLEAGFAPLVATLQDQLGRSIRYRSTRDYPRFMQLLEQGAVDLAYVQPFDYVRIAHQQGYRPLARRRDPLSARVVVNPRSMARGLPDLKGKTLGLPPTVAAISYLSRSLLKAEGLDSDSGAVTIQHFRTHDSCLQQLLVDNVDACAVGNSAVSSFEKQMDVQFRQIAQSATIPPSVIVGHKRLGAERLKQIRRILHRMEPEPETRRVLGLADSETLRPALDPEYDPVRAIWTAVAPEPNS